MAASAAALAAARGLHDCGVLVTFGAMVARMAGIGGATNAWRRILWGSVLLTWVSAPVWLVLQAGEMSGATTLGAAAAAAPLALFGTGFGHALLVRLLLVTLVAVLGGYARSRLVTMAGFLAAGLACVAQIWMGHAAAPDGAWQAPAAALHMLAVGAWIGALLPLVVGLGQDPVRSVRRFSAIGLVAVCTLAATALIQAMALVGGLPGLLGSAYGRTVLIKTALFAVLLGFAALNRFILSPALAGPLAHTALIRLRRSIYIETGLGAAAIFAAAWLAALPPGAHEQPVWPLSWQPAWGALDDPAIVASLEAAFVLLVVAVASIFAALRWRSRGRLLYPLGFAAGALGIWLIVPQLGAFTVPAYPSSFFESTTGLTKVSVAAGGVIYRAQCEDCHGPRGFGDGPLAARLSVRPAPLTGFHLLARSDGEMFWLLTKGLAAPGGGITMPGFEATLTEDQRWEAIDYVRALAGAEPADSPPPLHHHH